MSIEISDPRPPVVIIVAAILAAATVCGALITVALPYLLERAEAPQDQQPDPDISSQGRPSVEASTNPGDDTQPNKCPSTREEIARLIGGEAQYWTPPTWSQGAWVYKKKAEYISLRYPGFGRLDVWIDGVVEITSDNAFLLDEHFVDEASFHCLG